MYPVPAQASGPTGHMPRALKFRGPGKHSVFAWNLETKK